MTLQFHEIAEASHRIQNPLTHEKLMLLGDSCQFAEGMRQLDLACGKGELLGQWAQKYGLLGVGVDISEVFIAAAKSRAVELEVYDQLNFVVDDAAFYPQEFHEFDVVSCIGAGHIGGGLVGTLELMHTALKAQDGLLLVGEPYWHDSPPADALNALEITADTYATLPGTLDRFESLGLELIEMILATPDDWDRYETQHWLNVDTYLRENPDDPNADTIRSRNAHYRRSYLTYGRRYMGWGVFVLRASR